MDKPLTEDREEAGIAWASDVIGGKLVARERQARWRTQWILTFDVGGPAPKKVLLRGFRNPGYCEPNDHLTRARLEQEAGVLAALSDTPIETPGFLGFHKELGWALMEYIDGCEVMLTEEPDSDLRFQVYTGYVEALARLHAYPLDKLTLPSTLYRPKSCAEHRQRMIDTDIPTYRAFDLKRPEPTLELGIQWTLANTLKDERPIGLGFGDVGPNQFLYRDGAFASFIDVEYALIGDPLWEMAKMRSRDVTYHSGRMTEHLRHYGKTYEALTGVPLSMHDLLYWTVAGIATRVGFAVLGVQSADPMMIDLPFALAYEVQQKRCICEGLAEFYGLQLSVPLLPTPKETVLGPYHQALIGQLDRYYPDKLADPAERTFMQFSASMARTLARGDACQAEIERANVEELSDILGYRPSDIWAGLAKLQELIAVDHMADFERRLNFLYRMEVRRDFLFQPMQQATDVSLSRPMSRFDA